MLSPAAARAPTSGGSLGEGRPEAGYEPAVPGPHDPEVGLEVVGDHVLGLPEGELLDVQLVEHDLLQALHAFFDPRASRTIRGFVDDDDLPQGLAGLYGGGVAGGPP